MLPLLLACSLSLPAGTATLLPDTSGVSVTARPGKVWLEERAGQRLNFDLAVRNRSRDTLRLTSIEVSVYDGSNALVLRKFVDNNGFSPAINALSHHEVLPGGTVLVFNPFHTFADDIEPARLQYVFHFQTPKRAEKEARLDVRPVRYQPQTALTLPLSGRLLVWDGHDENAHHRRLDFLHPVAQQVGIRANFMRYAHDFVVVTDAGELHRGDGKKNTDYPGFDRPVHAPAAGRVVAAYAAQPDNDNGEDHFNPADMVGKDPLLLYGNYVVIDHGHGEYSLLGHLRQNSVAVKVGDAVRADQVVARVGSSGSSYFPHLHYELRTGKEMNVEGLPAYFRNFQLLRGRRQRTVASGAVDSGDFLLQTRKGE
ncbi:M23 family metallopeptidase [Hymenobacter busanensis]|uniref:M23 family metallopeptidase n=1 Tax=Hymenobacter busanensis TaxID=2607656 RepID=A0A7L4ZYP3_9BACT|nr:M23 family metallopeptidase [Hymenobacter busanensis]KAA9333270.1 M23 family metallopeptidase [Hymenobacter busanensis]QHJ08053.1 peptidoglycan DD-metalloendopeptidase family protein [Hymenobacter busanensis]